MAVGGIGQLGNAVLNQSTIVRAVGYSVYEMVGKVGMTKRLDLSRFELEHKPPPASARVPQHRDSNWTHSLEP
jgi:hypothetical protein